MSYSRRLLCTFSSALMLVGLNCVASRAAEKVTVSFGPFGRSIAVSDLRQFSETGSAPPDLASVLSIVDQEQRDSLLGGLKFKVPLNVVVMDKLLRSPQGDQLLTQLSGATSLPGGAEKLALRSALIGAASSEGGLGILSFLDAYPTPTLTIDLAAVQKLMKASSLLGSVLGGRFPGGLAPAPGTPATPPAPSEPSPESEAPSPEPIEDEGMEQGADEPN